MDDLLQKETERQRRLLEEARKAVEQEKARMRQGGPRKVEPQLGEPTVVEPSGKPANRREPDMRDAYHASVPPAPSETRAQPYDESLPLLCSVPDMRSALIPFEEGEDDSGWSKPFSLPMADMEPWLSFLRGYRQSCLFSESGAAGSGQRVDAAVQALFELKGIDIRLILEPAVRINGPVEYFDDADADSSAAGMRDAHRGQLARAVEKGRAMGDRLHDALLGEGYANLVLAWEKVHNRKPSVSELHFMLTTGRIKPPLELQPRSVEADDSDSDAPAVEVAEKKPEVASNEKQHVVKPEKGSRPGWRMAGRLFGALKSKLPIRDKRRFLFHLSHLVLVCAAIAAYILVMQVFG